MLESDTFDLGPPEGFVRELDDSQEIIELTDSMTGDTRVDIEVLFHRLVIRGEWDVGEGFDDFDLTPTLDSKIPHDESQEIPQELFDEMKVAKLEPLSIEIEQKISEFVGEGPDQREETWNPTAETGNMALSKAA